MLATFVLDYPPRCILVDRNVSCIFIGTLTGSIQTISLRPQETFKSINVISEGTSSAQCFSGHEAEVICLEVSLDNSVLFSGSMYRTLRVWLIKNHQCLRSLSFEGPVTNLHVSIFHTVNTFDFVRTRIPQLSRTVADSADLAAVLPLRFLDDFTDDDADSCNTVQIKETSHEEQRAAECAKLKQTHDVESLNSEIDSKIADLFKKLSEKF